MLMTEKRKFNRIYYVLNTIRKHPDSSKSEIKKLSGLSMEVVLNYIDYLTSEKLIYQSGRRGDGVGRKAETYRINSEGCRFVGVKFTANKFSGILIDFAGNVICNYERKYNRTKITVEELMNSIFDCIDELIAENTAYNISGIGISAPGLVDFENGVLKRYCDLIDVNPVPIKKIVEEKYGIDTYVDGTVKTKTIAYQLNKNNTVGNYVYMLIGAGCSLSMVLNDKLYSGENNFDGEIGHIRINGQNGACSCGKKGCLETVIGNSYILDKLKAAGKSVTDISDFATLVNSGDEKAVEILSEVTDATAYALSAVITICAPKQVVICGDYVDAPLYGKMLKEKIKEYCLEDLISYVQFEFIKNEKSDNAYDAAQLCYYKKFYYSKRT